MTPEREELNAAALEMAHRILTERSNHVSIFRARTVAKRLIAAHAEAEERDKPVKVDEWNGEEYCAGCNELLVFYEQVYCHGCGRRLEWI